MEIDEDFFLTHVWGRKGTFWRAYKVTSLTKNGGQWDATIECEQVSYKDFDNEQQKTELILHTLLMELDIDDKIELTDGVYLNIVKEYPYKEDTSKRRFLVNISNTPNDKINAGEYISRVMHQAFMEQMY